VTQRKSCIFHAVDSISFTAITFAPVLSEKLTLGNLVFPAGIIAQSGRTK